MYGFLVLVLYEKPYVFVSFGDQISKLPFSAVFTIIPGLLALKKLVSLFLSKNTPFLNSFHLSSFFGILKAANVELAVHIGTIPFSLELGIVNTVLLESILK